MKKTYIISIVLCIVLLPIEQLFAWGQEGHRIIAQIAYNHLDKKVRPKVDALLGTQGMIYLANWPDEIKSDTIYPTSYDWHFQDLDEGLSDEQVLQTLHQYPTDGGNLFRAMDSLTAAVQKDNTQHDAVVFLIHLMGDRFCPMHTGHKDDLGGNRVKVQWFHQPTNLHAIWDSKLIESQGYSYTEYATYLDNQYTNQKDSIVALTPEQILLHNYHFTKAIYDYQATWDGNAYHYIYHFIHPMEWQLYATGIHLAKLLNNLF